MGRRRARLFAPVTAVETVKARKSVIGRPFRHVDIRICDGNSELAPIGVRGELWIGAAESQGLSR